MKKRTRILAAISVLMSMSACNESEDFSPANTLPEIKISAGIGDMTRLKYDGKATRFTVGDEIMVYGWVDKDAPMPTNPPIAAVNTLTPFLGSSDVGIWKPKETMYWQSMSAYHNFLGIYPVPTATGNFETVPYELKVGDQQASDLLLARNHVDLSSTTTKTTSEDTYYESSDEVSGGGTQTGGEVALRVSLQFTHVMAKFQLNLQFGNEIQNREVTQVRLYCDTKATVNYQTKTVNAPAYEFAANKYITLPEVTENASYASVVIPQEGVKRIEIDVNDRTYRYDYEGTEGKGLPLTSNKITTLNMVIGRTSMDTSAKVSAWDGGETYKGETQETDNSILTSTAAGTIASNWESIGQYLHTDGTLRVAGPLDAADLRAIGSFGLANDNLVTLDLSGVTGVTEIPGNMFYQPSIICTSLKRVILPPSITTIGAQAFRNSSALKDINLSHITQVGNVAFEGTALIKVSLDAATSIETSAFWGCPNLTKASMPLATTLGRNLFYGCSALKEIILTAEYFEAVTSDEDSKRAHIHPFTGIPQGVVTLTLNASQRRNVTAGVKFWRPKKSDGTTSAIVGSGSYDVKGYVDLRGFKAVYCGDTKIF